MLALSSLSASIRRGPLGSRRAWQVSCVLAVLLPASEVWGDAGAENSPEAPEQPAADPRDQDEAPVEGPAEAPRPEPPPEPIAEPPLLVPEPVEPPPPPLPPPTYDTHPSNPGSSPRLRAGHEDGVLVLSNRDDLPADPAPQPPPDSEPVRKSEPLPEATVGDTPAAVGGIADGLVTRSLRRKDTEASSGLGWVWFLVGAAVLLLVPIGLLLTRGSRPSGTGSLPPSSRLSAQPPSSDPSRVSVQPPSADQKR